MGCRSEYMEPTAREKESRFLAEALLQVDEIIVGLGFQSYLYMPEHPSLPTYERVLKENSEYRLQLEEASKHVYGSVTKTDEWTAVLCAIMNDFSDNDDFQLSLIKNNLSSVLAWFEKHKKFDAKRISEEKLKAKQEQLEQTVKEKINSDLFTDEERDFILGKL